MLGDDGDAPALPRAQRRLLLQHAATVDVTARRIDRLTRSRGVEMYP